MSVSQRVSKAPKWSISCALPSTRPNSFALIRFVCAGMVERKVQNWKSVCEDIYKSIHEFVNDPSQVGLALTPPTHFPQPNPSPHPTYLQRFGRRLPRSWQRRARARRRWLKTPGRPRSARRGRTLPPLLRGCTHTHTYTTSLRAD